MMHDMWLRANGIHQTIQDGRHARCILQSVDLAVPPGQSVAIMGPSGSGKSTLLYILSGLIKPDQGDVKLGPHHLTQLNQVKLGRIRQHMMGFMYQSHHLMKDFSVLENLIMPLLIAGHSSQTARQRAQDLLPLVGMGHIGTHQPISHLSGGERQRLALLRAVAIEPQVVFADEPTGNLDREQAQLVCGFLINMVRELGMTLLLVTHDPVVARQMDQTLELQQGTLVPYVWEHEG